MNFCRRFSSNNLRSSSSLFSLSALAFSSKSSLTISGFFGSSSSNFNSGLVEQYISNYECIIQVVNKFLTLDMVLL